MKPYHKNNLKLQPYGAMRIIFLAWVAKLLGVHFHVCGVPFGSAKSAYKLRDKVEKGRLHYGRSIS